jgi:hypothetical protein
MFRFVQDTAQAGNDRRQGEELHSPSMVSYRAKGINKFTPVNLRLLGQQPARRDFSLSRSRFNKFTNSNLRLLRSTRSGVTCHPPHPTP